MPTTLITGANRGLGLEFVRQYDGDGWRVYACCRRPSEADALRGIAAASDGRVTVHALDVADHGSVDALAAELKDAAIDLLLNNAGVMGARNGFGEIDYDLWGHVLRVNTMGPMKVTEAFVEQVARSERKVVAHVTSKMGSIADNTSGHAYVYRSSKAALNAVNMSLSHDLRRRGIVAVVVHPGWVKTDMGGQGAPTEIPESISGMREVLGKLTERDSGRFFDFTGAEIPW